MSHNSAILEFASTIDFLANTLLAYTYIFMHTLAHRRTGVTDTKGHDWETRNVKMSQSVVVQITRFNLHECFSPVIFVIVFSNDSNTFKPHLVT